MSILETQNLSSLKLYMDKGLNDNSKRVTGTKTFAFVDPITTNQDLLEVANAIAGLQKHDVFNIVRLDNVSLSE